MSLSELRAELKSLRKSANPVPASRMKKAAVAMEIARLKGVAPPSTPEKEDKPKAKAEKPKKEVSIKATEPEVKKTKSVKAQEVVVPMVKDEKKPAKGSEEMKARMAALREKRAKKSE